MNTPVSADSQILLVGDGDFSFSLALTKYLDPSCIITSNLETEESIKKYNNAQFNMEKLKEKGVNVILNVDARQLHTNPDLNDHNLKRIVFNFPHIGGKSNNKRNRALLNDFFKSASHVLSPFGQIMVTLCQGQGGTPADNPRRSWPDSWQVVAMAANSSFILTEVIPFETNLYFEYSCTGFRSQDKGFLTRGGLTHVFQRQEPVTVPECIDAIPIAMDQQSFQCPLYLSSKIQAYRELMETSSYHPLKTILYDVIAQLSSLTSCRILPENTLPYILSQQKNSFPLYSTTYILQQQNGTNCCDISLVPMSSQEPNNQEPNITSSVPNQSCDQQNERKNRCDSCKPLESHLRTTLLENLPALLEMEVFQEQQLILVNGLTFNKGIISKNFLPISLDLLGIMPCSEETLSTEEFFELISTSLENLGIKSNSYVYQEKSQLIQTDTISVVCLSQISYLNDGVEMNIGTVWKISKDSGNSLQHFLSFILVIPTLAQATLSIPHKCLLWLSNFKKFVTISQKESSLNSLGCCVPITVFPLQFDHDMSFWENSNLVFDEFQLSDIVRDVAGDCVSNVALIDSYEDPETHRKSQCYRLVFQSWHRCLSYDISWKLQSFIRLRVAEQMAITLR